MTHDGRTAVVTGGANGIGRATAEELAKRGASVALLDVADDVEDVAGTMRDTDYEVVGVQADVSDPSSVDSAIEAVEEEFGGVDILVNNAGIAANTDTVLEMSLDAYERDLAVNLTGMFICTKRCLPSMFASEWGRIVNISSGTATLGGYGQAGYASSKAGVLGLTKTTALEGARKGVTCNAVIPGLIETGIHEDFDPNLVDRMLKRVPSREWGQPEDIANAVAFLSKDESRYVNGEQFNVDAGIRLFTY